MQDPTAEQAGRATAVDHSGFFAKVGLAVLFLALAGIAVFGHSFSKQAVETSPRGQAAGFPLDDAWIHQVYARSLWQTGRFDYNRGAAELGSSSPLWTLLLAPLHAGGSAETLPDRVRFAGMLTWMLLALAAANLARRLFPPAPRTAAAVAALLVALRPEFGFASASGMEPLLFASLALFALERVFCGRPAAAGVLAGLAILARPEGACVAAVVLGFTFLEPAPGRSRLGSTLTALLGVAPFALAWIGFCEVVSGRPLPNTFYAKAETIALTDMLDGAGRALSRLLHDSVYYRVPTSYLLLAMGFIGILARVGWKRGIALLLVPLGLVFGVALSRSLPPVDAFYWSRYTLPAAPFLDLLLAIGIAGALATILDLSRPEAEPAPEPETAAEDAIESDDEKTDTTPANQALEVPAAPRSAGLEVPKPILSILLFVIAVLPFTGVADGMKAAIERYGKEVSDVDSTNVTAARFLAEHGGLGANDVVAAQDAGAARYFLPCRVLDLLGLNDHAIVTLFLSDGDVGRYLAEQRPRAFFLLDPDAGATQFAMLANSLGLAPLQRFAVPDYSVLGPPQDKGVVLFTVPTR